MWCTGQCAEVLEPGNLTAHTYAGVSFTLLATLIGTSTILSAIVCTGGIASLGSRTSGSAVATAALDIARRAVSAGYFTATTSAGDIAGGVTGTIKIAVSLRARKGTALSGRTGTISSRTHTAVIAAEQHKAGKEGKEQDSQVSGTQNE